MLKVDSDMLLSLSLICVHLLSAFLPLRLPFPSVFQKASLFSASALIPVLFIRQIFGSLMGETQSENGQFLMKVVLCLGLVFSQCVELLLAQLGVSKTGTTSLDSREAKEQRGEIEAKEGTTEAKGVKPAKGSADNRGGSTRASVSHSQNASKTTIRKGLNPKRASGSVSIAPSAAKTVLNSPMALHEVSLPLSQGLDLESGCGPAGKPQPAEPAAFPGQVLECCLADLAVFLPAVDPRARGAQRALFFGLAWLFLAGRSPAPRPSRLSFLSFPLLALASLALPPPTLLFLQLLLVGRTFQLILVDSVYSATSRKGPVALPCALVLAGGSFGLMALILA